MQESWLVVESGGGLTGKSTNQGQAPADPEEVTYETVDQGE